jgi:hypothetical protein
MGRHDALRDRARRIRASRGRPSRQAPKGRERDGDETRQKPEERAIGRPKPGWRERCDERAHAADDCLGRAGARDVPATARVAARHRKRKDEGCAHR